MPYFDYEGNELTDKVKAQLAELEKVLGEPVLPLSRFCWAMNLWADGIDQGVRDNPDDTAQQGRDYRTNLLSMFTDIRKSGLMSRLIYRGEGLRKKKCPAHKGHMDCGMWVGMRENVPPNCECDGSGWVPGSDKEEKSNGHD